MAAMAIIEALLGAIEADISFGVLDAKGETFDRTIFLIARLLENLPPAGGERLRSRVVIIDFASMDAITAYNVAAPWSGADFDYFATSRMETLQELFPAGDGISLRGSSILKYMIKLLAEHHLPFSYADQVLSSEPFRHGLSPDPRMKISASTFRSISRANRVPQSPPCGPDSLQRFSAPRASSLPSPAWLAPDFGRSWIRARSCS